MSDTNKPDLTAVTLADLASRPQWVAWRNEQRGDDVTKVPYYAAERLAEADNPATWIPHDQAVLVSNTIVNGYGGGVGIELGQCGPYWIAGNDLDTCRDPVTGVIEPWAIEVIERLDTYVEVSPSGTGVKQFFLVDAADVPELRTIMGTQHGRQFKRPNGGKHPPAIELYTSHRYFAVTWQGLSDAPTELRTVPLDDLRWLIKRAGPALAGKTEGKRDDPGTRRDTDGDNRDPSILARLDTAAKHNKLIATAIVRAATLRGGSRSEGALGLGAALKRAGWTFADMKAALRTCPATRDWATEHQTEGDRQFERIWAKASERPETPETPETQGPSSDADEPPPGDAQIIWPTITEISEIIPRPWAYGRFLLFGTASCIGAMDGSGKGMTAVVMVLAMITGYPLLGEKVWRTGKVAIISYEDDIDEWKRRIAAACLCYSARGFALDYKTMLRSIVFITKPGGRVTLAERDQDRVLIFPDTPRIVFFLKQIKAVGLVIDPFNNAHGMEDGNNNVAIAAVAQEISTIAREANVAALLLHHLRKSSTGSIDDLMGATSLRANFRNVRIHAGMSEEEAQQFGIPSAEAWRFFYLSGSKENYAPPLMERVWFEKVSVKLDNPAGIYTEGDEVGAVVRWTPPALFKDFNNDKLRPVFDAIAAKPHSPVRRATAIDWVGKPLMDLAGRNQGQAGAIVAQWLQSKTLIPGAPFKTEGRNAIQTVTVDPAKVAAILAGLRPPSEPREPDDD